MFVPGKPFQPSLVFSVRLEPTRVKNLSGAPLKGGLLALTTNTRLGWKGLPETNSSLLWKSVNYGRNMLYDKGPWTFTNRLLPKLKSLQWNYGFEICFLKIKLLNKLDDFISTQNKKVCLDSLKEIAQYLNYIIYLYFICNRQLDGYG